MDGSVQIPFEAKAGGLVVRFNNRDLVDRKPATFKAVADLIKAHQAKVVLVDMRGIPGEASFLDRYEMGEMSARHLPRVALAVLIRDDQADRGQIGIMVAANRGMRIEIFTDAAAAEKWFEGHVRPQPPNEAPRA
jgi:hypothetical protein